MKNLVWFCVCFLMFTGVAFCRGVDPSFIPMEGPVESEGPSPGQIWRDPYLGMEFVWVPGGCYEMGCGEWAGSCYSDGYPVHTVCVDGFWLGRYEVTNEQFVRFLNEIRRDINVDDDDVYYEGHMIFDWRYDGYGYDGYGDWKDGIRWTGSHFELINGKDKHPVVMVTWYGAKAFAKWLSQKTGHKFRLPTEAEWEYACRSGGKKVKYGTSSGKLSRDLANYRGTGGRDRWKHTSPVGSFPPNQLGLYDMSGNVWEWCEDVYAEDAYKHHSRNNPIYTGSGRYRVIRGGSCYNFPGYMRCAFRSEYAPALRDIHIGFRLLRQK